MDCVVVGVDGSVESAAALRWAADFAHASGAQLTGVFAQGLLDRDAGGSRVPAHRRSAVGLDAARQHWNEALADSGVSGDFVVRDGSPVSALLAAADAESADLIVVGRRGSGATTALLGSTSRELVQDASRPVVVVPIIR